MTGYRSYLIAAGIAALSAVEAYQHVPLRECLLHALLAGGIAALRAAIGATTTPTMQGGEER